MSPLWKVKSDIETTTDKEPHRTKGNIEYVERYVGDFTYKIPTQSYLKFPFVKTTKLDRIIIERIVGIYIIPKLNRVYNVSMDTDDKLLTLNIEESSEMKFKNRLEDQGKQANNAVHKNWFSINPVKNRFYRVEIHVDPSNNNFHLESTEVEKMKEDGFSK